MRVVACVSPHGFAARALPRVLRRMRTTPMRVWCRHTILKGFFEALREEYKGGVPGDDWTMMWFNTWAHSPLRAHAPRLHVRHHYLCPAHVRMRTHMHVWAMPFGGSVPEGDFSSAGTSKEAFKRWLDVTESMVAEKRVGLLGACACACIMCACIVWERENAHGHGRR